MSRRGRPPKIGVDRNDSGRIRYRKPDIRNGPRWSREYQWLRDHLSEQALEAARWYVEWIEHRNRWLDWPDRKLPGDDLTVSERLGRKCFTGLIMAPPGVTTLERYALTPSPYAPREASDEGDRNDRESPYLGLP